MLKGRVHHGFPGTMRALMQSPDGTAHGGMAAGSARLVRLALFWASLVSLLLLVLPRLFPGLAWLAWPQIMLGTLVHELGHGLAALLAGGTFESLKLFADGSGVAATRSPGTPLARAWVAAGGLFGPPLLGALLFVLARNARLARAALGVMALVLLVALLCWVRNALGWIWTGACTALLIGVAARGSVAVAQAFTCFLAVQLCLASLTRMDYLFAARARTGLGELASDSAQIAAQLGGPHWFWGGLVMIGSIGLMLAGLGWFLRAGWARATMI